MRTIKAMAIASAVFALTACSSEPKDIDIQDLKGMSLESAAGVLAEGEFVLKVTNPSAAENKHWIVTGFAPLAAPKGSEITINVESTLKVAAVECGVEEYLKDDGASITLNSHWSKLGNEPVFCFINEVKTPQSTISKITSTRALDGMQSDDFDGLEASWTYHPDNGLNIIFEIDQ